MSALEIIALCDEREPNHYDSAQKLRWLYELDMRMARELRQPVPEVYLRGSERLSLGRGHEEMYIQWLIARISAANGETERYNRAIALFNDSYAAMAAHSIRQGIESLSSAFSF